MASSGMARSGPLLIKARYLVPVRPSKVVLEHHAVLVEHGRISAVMPQDEVPESHDFEVIDLPSHVLMPGLVNMHTHSPMTLLRGFADDMDLQVWLEQHIWPAEQAFVSPEFVRDGTVLAMAEMLRSGTTYFNDNYFFPDAMAQAAVDAGMRAGIGLPLIEFATPWAGSIDEYFSRGVALKQQWDGEELLDFTLAPHSPYTVNNDTLREVRRHSLEHDMLVHFHILETEWDIKHSLQHYDRPPLQRLDELDLLNEQLLAVHMTQLSAQDIERVAQRGVNVVHCPNSNLKLASGICPLDALLKAGVNVAVGTDGAASNNDLDLFSETQCAALLAKGVSGDPSALDAFTAVEMMTINGAIALGKEQDMGSVEAGKWADLCAVNLQTPELQPVHNLFSQLVYACPGRHVSDVWVGGRRLLHCGELTSIDLEALYSTVDDWQQRLQTHRESGISQEAGSGAI